MNSSSFFILFWLLTLEIIQELVSIGIYIVMDFIKRHIFHFLKVLAVLLVIAYIQIMYVDTGEEPRYDNGQLKSYGAYQNGRPDGKWTWWFEDGKKMSEGYFSNGKRNGEWTTWFSGGQPMSSGQYVNDKLEGRYLKWHRNGIVAFEGNYKQDRLDGVQKYYEATGKLTKMAEYSMGELNQQSMDISN